MTCSVEIHKYGTADVWTFWAECSCGWSCDQSEDENDAVTGGLAHLKAGAE